MTTTCFKITNTFAYNAAKVYTTRYVSLTSRGMAIIARFLHPKQSCPQVARQFWQKGGDRTVGASTAVLSHGARCAATNLQETSQDQTQHGDIGYEYRGG